MIILLYQIQVRVKGEGITPAVLKGKTETAVTLLPSLFPLL
jgi:hypothetical protein